MAYVSAYAVNAGKEAESKGLENEDAAIAFIKDNVLYQIVSDGNGSVKDMKPANFIINEIQRFINEYSKAKMSSNSIKQLVSHACYCANRVLIAFKRANGELYTNSNFATLTMAAVTDTNELIYAHCGDSRLYLMRNHKLIQLSKDHTAAQNLYENGKISREQISSHPDNVIITSAMGFSELRLDVVAGSVKQGDILIGVTDGIHKLLDHEKILKVIETAGNCEDTCDGLIQYANSLGGYDNMAAFVTYIAE